MMDNYSILDINGRELGELPATVVSPLSYGDEIDIDHPHEQFANRGAMIIVRVVEVMKPQQVVVVQYSNADDALAATKRLLTNHGKCEVCSEPGDITAGVCYTCATMHDRTLFSKMVDAQRSLWAAMAEYERIHGDDDNLANTIQAAAI